ncbi:hypothetical protein J6590_004017, partial [Homalodisca vitripennis]
MVDERSTLNSGTGAPRLYRGPSLQGRCAATPHTHPIAGHWVPSTRPQPANVNKLLYFEPRSALRQR